MKIEPLPPRCLGEAFPEADAACLVEHYAAWGCVPRYWELAAAERGDVAARIERLLLDPLGSLHQEPDRLLLEDIPPAKEIRPVLDAIGSGAHRLSEIAGRMGSPATSLSRPIRRLLDMGLVRREIPFGEPGRKTKTSLYRIADPCLRLWFRCVSPYQALLASTDSAGRLAMFRRHWEGLRAEAFEELCRMQWPRYAGRSPLRSLGPFGPASRWWRANAPEWDLVSAAMSGDTIILGSAHFSERPLTRERLGRLARDLAARPAPELPPGLRAGAVRRALLVPALAPRTSAPEGILLVTAADLLAGPAGGE